VWFAFAGAVLVAATATVGGASASGRSDGGVVRVPHGQSVQIAVVVDTQSPEIGDLGRGVRNAVAMAATGRTIHGFPVQLNVFDTPSLVVDDPNAVADNTATAQQIVANTQTVAVIGHETSLAFGNVEPPNGTCPAPVGASALSIYEAAEVVTINGSTTNPCLPPLGPTVFNATAVPGDPFDAWYAGVTALPSDAAWSLAYQQRFGVAPTPFADLYYDAANLLLAKLQSVAKIAHGNLVVPRGALAEAVRGTTGFCGVTGTISLDPTGYRINVPSAC
jgi:ABC-type branched-subunit amino acid transport system substrate-binding protein